MNSDSEWDSYDNTWGISLSHVIIPEICNSPYISSSIEETNSANDVWIYPNPTANDITVHIPSANMLQTPVKLYDIAGKQLNIEQDIRTDKVILHLSSLSSGIYFININIDNQTITRKISLIK